MVTSNPKCGICSKEVTPEDLQVQVDIISVMIKEQFPHVQMSREQEELLASHGTGDTLCVECCHRKGFFEKAKGILALIANDLAKAEAQVFWIKKGADCE